MVLSFRRHPGSGGACRAQRLCSGGRRHPDHHQEVPRRLPALRGRRWSRRRSRSSSDGSSPDLILTHYRGDLHQDHRLISELTWNTFRNHLILEYEIPKYDGDLGSAERLRAARRVALPAEDRHDSRELSEPGGQAMVLRRIFRSLLRLRGMEMQCASEYAEAFYCRKLVVRLGDDERTDADARRQPCEADSGDHSDEKGGLKCVRTSAVRFRPPGSGDEDRRW